MKLATATFSFLTTTTRLAQRRPQCAARSTTTKLDTRMMGRPPHSFVSFPNEESVVLFKGKGGGGKPSGKPGAGKGQGPGNGAGWPSTTTGHPSGGGRSNNPPPSK